MFEDVDEDLDKELAQLSLGRYTLYTYKFYGIFLMKAIYDHLPLLLNILINLA